MTGDTDYAALVNLLKEFHEFQRPIVRDGVPDYTAAAMKTQRRGLKKFQGRLAAIAPGRWAIGRQVDYHLVRAQMNGLEFDHRVLRPWSRDPAFYVTTSFQFGPKMYGALGIPRLPIAAGKIERFRMKLLAIPAILEQAEGNLTEPAADLAMLGIRAKRREIAIFRGLAERMAAHHPRLVPDVKRAAAALERFRKWLASSKRKITAPAGIGITNYNWYLKNVHLLPYTWDELLTISKCEYERAVASIKLEEHRNRKRPRLRLARTAAQLKRSFSEAQRHLWNFLRKEQILTVPPYMAPKRLGSFGRPRGVRDYFQQIQYRDPLPLMPHDFVGHGPDEVRHTRDRRPVRGGPSLYFISAIRAEGLATGIEEVLMHAGLLDKRPRSRELTYNLLAFRAARAISDLKMHSNEFTLMDGFRFNMEMTPYGWLPQDSRTMWHDIELYMRQPGYGASYLIGSVQLRQLIADRGAQLGGGFNLRRFMDRFLAAGMIPITLTRWEMTGLDDQIRRLW